MVLATGSYLVPFSLRVRLPFIIAIGLPLGTAVLVVPLWTFLRRAQQGPQIMTRMHFAARHVPGLPERRLRRSSAPSGKARNTLWGKRGLGE